MSAKNEKLRERAQFLRKELRWSVDEISNNLGSVSRRTVAYWVSGIPLSDQEHHDRKVVATTGPRKTSKRLRQLAKPASKFSSWVTVSMSRDQKGRIAEAATLYRLAVHDLTVMSHVFDGGGEDWLVINKHKAFIRVQVKWARLDRQGLPVFNARRSSGRKAYRRYRADEVDFFVAYDFRTDTAYVFSEEEISGKATVTIKEDASERWDKLINFRSNVAP